VGSAACRRTRTVTGDLRGCAAISPHRGFEVKELGGIDMVPMRLAALDLVTHDDARSAFPVVYGQLAGVLRELIG
jgi:hypothetical protein